MKTLKRIIRKIGEKEILNLQIENSFFEGGNGGKYLGTNKTDIIASNVFGEIKDEKYLLKKILEKAGMKEIDIDKIETIKF